MNDVAISELLVKATREMLKDYANIRFYSHYDKHERRINVNELINIFESILDRIRDSHPSGDKLYLVLYQSFFHSKRFKRSQLCEYVGSTLINRPITESTLYRWQQMAIKVFAYALWTSPQFSDDAMKIFNNLYLKENYNDICMEHKRLRNS